MGPVIDIHCHMIACGKKSGAVVSKRILKNPFFKIFMKKYGYRPGAEDAFDKQYADMLAQAVRESEYLDYAVALALDGLYDSKGKLDESRTDACIPNEYVRDACRERKELLFGASVSPDRADALDMLDKVKAEGAVLMKWVPPSHDIDPANPKYIPFYRKLAELKLPLLSHTGYEHSVAVTDQMYGDPLRLKTALDEGVTVIAAHCGTAGHGHPVEFFDGYVEMLKMYPNLWGDLSALCTPSRFGYIDRVMAVEGFFERQIQAIDYPVPPMPFLFINKLGFRKVSRLNKVKNMFDRDIKTKFELGFPQEMLYKAGPLLGVTEKPA